MELTMNISAYCHRCFDCCYIVFFSKNFLDLYKKVKKSHLAKGSRKEIKVITLSQRILTSFSASGLHCHNCSMYLSILPRSLLESLGGISNDLTQLQGLFVWLLSPRWSQLEAFLSELHLEDPLEWPYECALDNSSLSPLTFFLFFIYLETTSHTFLYPARPRTLASNP